ncbi:MAG: hypothetical protein AB7I18_12040 [Candidatus Berkiella sp.]
MKIPFTNIKVSKKEAISLGVGAAWAGFTLAFGSAPLSLLTATATPLLTTVITAAAVVTAGFVGKKAADYGQRLAARAQNNPDGYFARGLEKVGFDLDKDDTDYGYESEDSDLDEDQDASIDNDEVAGLRADQRNPIRGAYAVEHESLASRAVSLITRRQNVQGRGYTEAEVQAKDHGYNLRPRKWF